MEKTDSMKYLGVKIHKHWSFREHVESRRNKAIKASYSLALLGTTTQAMGPLTKIKLYKQLVRPILLYGIESATLTKKDQRVLQTCESSIVKRWLGLPKYIHTTETLAACRLEPLSMRIPDLKIKFLRRAIDHPIIKDLTENELTERWDDTANEIRDCAREAQAAGVTWPSLDLEGVDDVEQAMAIVKGVCAEQIRSIREATATLFEEDHLVKQLKELVVDVNRKTTRDRLIELVTPITVKEWQKKNRLESSQTTRQ